MTQTLTTDELRQIVDSHEKCYGMSVPINYGYLAARELLANREAQPVGYAENGKGFIYHPEHRDRIQNPVAVYIAPPAPAVQKDVEAVVGLMESGEWAEHCTKSELGQRLESAITALIGITPPAPVVNPEFTGATAVPDDSDPRDEFESVFPMPKYVVRCGAGYAVTAYSAWGAHDFNERWVGWNACRAAMLAQPVRRGCTVVPLGWIDCAFRVPDTDGNYWGWWSESKRQGPVWFIKSDVQAQFQSSEITHWMPLPAAPEGGNG